MLAFREEKRRLHEERIWEAKRGRAEHLKSKNAARRWQKMEAGERRLETKEEEEEEEEDVKTNDGTTEDADEGDAKTTSGSAIHPRRGDSNAMGATPSDRTSAAATGPRDAAGDRDGGEESSSMSSPASIVVAGGRSHPGRDARGRGPGIAPPPPPVVAVATKASLRRNDDDVDRDRDGSGIVRQMRRRGGVHDPRRDGEGGRGHEDMRTNSFRSRGKGCVRSHSVDEGGGIHRD